MISKRRMGTVGAAASAIAAALAAVVAVSMASLGGVGGPTSAGAAPPAAREAKETKEAKAVLTADQVIASVRTAVAAKPGGVTEVEAEKEGNATVCEVGIRATEDGKDYDVEVDVATNRVLEIEAEDGEDADSDDAVRARR